MMAAIKYQDERVGARAEWVWEFWQNDWVWKKWTGPALCFSLFAGLSAGVRSLG
jgi:hypothetical protein